MAGRAHRGVGDGGAGDCDCHMEGQNGVVRDSIGGLGPAARTAECGDGSCSRPRSSRGLRLLGCDCGSFWGNGPCASRRGGSPSAPEMPWHPVLTAEDLQASAKAMAHKLLRGAFLVVFGDALASGDQWCCYAVVVACCGVWGG